MAEDPTRQQPGAAQRTYPRTARASLKLEDGRIVVEDAAGGEVVRVGNGGVIHWDCDASIRWWAIVMKSDTPFDGDDGWAGGRPGKPGVTKVRGDANGSNVRSYEYAIVASNGSEVIFRDPEIEVGPVGGGGDDGGG